MEGESPAQPPPQAPTASAPAPPVPPAPPFSPKAVDALLRTDRTTLQALRLSALLAAAYLGLYQCSVLDLPMAEVPLPTLTLWLIAEHTLWFSGVFLLTGAAARRKGADAARARAVRSMAGTGLVFLFVFVAGQSGLIDSEFEPVGGLITLSLRVVCVWLAGREVETLCLRYDKPSLADASRALRWVLGPALSLWLLVWVVVVAAGTFSIDLERAPRVYETLRSGESVAEWMIMGSSMVAFMILGQLMAAIKATKRSLLQDAAMTCPA